ncbi:MATE family efflux transporter [bacterium]|nr:MATE family efflux transporter [candidate division CSSED10-310 bacterium]
MKKHNAGLLTGPVNGSLLRMTLSMMIGFIAGAAFNITDTYWVSLLGTKALAAMGYTFPIVMCVHSLIMGVGIGTASVVSRSIGGGNTDEVKRLSMHALLLGLFAAILFVCVGRLSLHRLLVGLGAEGEILAMASQYMTIWFAGIIFVIVPMLGNNVIRATGDTLTPSIIMTADLGLNVVLDPLFIFGWGPLPPMGIEGAALATVISRAFSLVAGYYVLDRWKGLITFRNLALRTMFSSWRRILYIGVPTGATNMLTPVTAGFITRVVSGFGTETVAALSAGTRIEHMAVIPILALGASLVPFIGQNWGAGRLDRVIRAQALTFRYCIFWGMALVIGLSLVSGTLAGVFTGDPLVLESLSLYLTIMPAAFMFRGLAMTSNSGMNAVNRPLDSSANTILRLIIVQWPLVLVGARYFGFRGLLFGVVLSEILTGLFAAAWVRRLLRKLGTQSAAAGPAPLRRPA